MSANKTPAKISDVLRNHVKEKLARGEVVASMTVRLIRGIEIARIAKTAGFDSLYVDMEHSSFSLETMGQICMAALEVGITPFVRVPGLADVQRILDAGALGIIAPHVRSELFARNHGPDLHGRARGRHNALCAGARLSRRAAHPRRRRARHHCAPCQIGAFRSKPWARSAWPRSRSA